MTHSTADFSDSLLQAYTGQVRVRVGGLLVQNGAILLAAHRGLLPANVPFWSPPGGGWEFGETIRACLRREFQEETGMSVEVGRFLHLHEFMNKDLQALELFFEVKPLDSTAVPRLGSDPEHPHEGQILTKLAYFTPRQLVSMPVAQVHPVLRLILSPDDVYIPLQLFK
ncbi:NUDIX domain-containing protein [Hymenobacter sp. BT730]|uniref:NUDIX domain-containing protein n=1 Tax=Hymenobacter sp. BT730 TaxID=3063332 RepID=UPI0026DEDB1F|nr:NUDIX domain-containing protein [Hymenobacter sp. BT730]